MPWWNGSCDLQYAENPEDSFPALEWIPCFSGETGCERVRRNWPQLSATAIAGPWVRREGNGYRVNLGAKLPEFESRMVAFDVDGKPTTVYRVPPHGECILTRLAPASDGHWFGAQNIGEPPVYVFQPDGVPPSEAVVTGITSGSQQQDGGESLYAIEYDFAAGLEVYDRTTQQKFASPKGLGISLPSFHDGAAFFAAFPSFNQPDGWVWTRARGAFEPLVVRDPKHVLDVRGDGQYLVWLESDSDVNGTWPPAQLYTSPYTTVQSQVAPTLRRSLVAVGPIPSAAIGGGYYTFFSAYDARLTVIRLNDAHQWKFALPVDEHRSDFRGITYIDGEYIFFRSDVEMYRQRLDALGPGEAAN